MKNKLLLFLIVTALISCDYYSDARKTTFDETKASTVLKKYEYFKDLSAQIDVQRSNIEVYKEIIKDKSADDYTQRKSEYYGLIANYNDLVGKYNAGMSKINYAFANFNEDSPYNNLQPLPKEFKPYIIK